MGQGFSNNRVAFAGNGITQIFVNGVKQATTSGTEFDFAIPSGVKEIKCIFNEVSLSGTNWTEIQIGDSSGIKTTGYLGSASRMGTGVTTANSTGAFSVYATGSTENATGIMILSLLDEATNTWVASGTLATGVTALTYTTGGVVSLDSELTTVRLTRDVTSTFNGGSFNIQYDNPDPTVVADSSSGKVVQTVNVQDGEYASTTTLAPQDDTILQNTEGGEFMTVSITPTNVANKLKIEVNTYLHNSAASWINYGIFQDSTADAIVSGEQYGTTGTGAYNVGLIYWMDAGTTSSTTFKFRAGQHIAGTFGMNGASTRRGGGVRYSSMTITEYKS